MSDDVRLAELTAELGELSQRVARVETTLDMQTQLVVAELKGYLDGQVRSVNGNINESYRELSQRLETLDKDLRTHIGAGTAKVTGILVFCAISAALLTTLLAERFGFITRLAGP